MKTLALLKPHAAQDKSVVCQIIQQILRHGFVIHQRKRITLTVEQAKAFYAEHAGRSYFDLLITSITSGPVEALILEHEQRPAETIALWRAAMGATDSSKAEPGSLRSLFGNPQILRENALHGSDGIESATREIALIFTAENDPPKLPWVILAALDERDENRQLSAVLPLTPSLVGQMQRYQELIVNLIAQDAMFEGLFFFHSAAVFTEGRPATALPVASLIAITPSAPEVHAIPINHQRLYLTQKGFRWTAGHLKSATLPFEIFTKLSHF